MSFSYADLTLKGPLTSSQLTQELRDLEIEGRSKLITKKEKLAALRTAYRARGLKPKSATAATASTATAATSSSSSSTRVSRSKKDQLGPDCKSKAKADCGRDGELDCALRGKGAKRTCAARPGVRQGYTYNTAPTQTKREKRSASRERALAGFNCRRDQFGNRILKKDCDQVNNGRCEWRKRMGCSARPGERADHNRQVRASGGYRTLDSRRTAPTLGSGSRASTVYGTAPPVYGTPPSSRPRPMPNGGSGPSSSRPRPLLNPSPSDDLRDMTLWNEGRAVPSSGKLHALTTLFHDKQDSRIIEWYDLSSALTEARVDGDRELFTAIYAILVVYLQQERNLSDGTGPLTDEDIDVLRDFDAPVGSTPRVQYDEDDKDKDVRLWSEGLDEAYASGNTFKLGELADRFHNEEDSRVIRWDNLTQELENSRARQNQAAFIAIQVIIREYLDQERNMDDIGDLGSEEMNLLRGFNMPSSTVTAATPVDFSYAAPAGAFPEFAINPEPSPPRASSRPSSSRPSSMALSAASSMGNNDDQFFEAQSSLSTRGGSKDSSTSSSSSSSRESDSSFEGSSPQASRPQSQTRPAAFVVQDGSSDNEEDEIDYASDSDEDEQQPIPIQETPKEKLLRQKRRLAADNYKFPKGYKQNAVNVNATFCRRFDWEIECGGNGVNPDLVAASALHPRSAVAFATTPDAALRRSTRTIPASAVATRAAADIAPPPTSSNNRPTRPPRRSARTNPPAADTTPPTTSRSRTPTATVGRVTRSNRRINPPTAITTPPSSPPAVARRVTRSSTRNPLPR